MVIPGGTFIPESRVTKKNQVIFSSLVLDTFSIITGTTRGRTTNIPPKEQSVKMYRW